MAADGNGNPFGPASPVYVRGVGMRGTKQEPVFVTPSGTVPMRITNTSIPVAVTKALPALNAKNWNVQNLDKYTYQKSRLFDILPWGAAGVGASSYRFFSRAVGTGAATPEDTNMPQANNIGQNNAFVITRMAVAFISGIRPVITAADAALVAANQVNDTWNVLSRGVAQFNVNGQGMFFNTGIGPLTAFPAPQNFRAYGGIATGNAAADIAETMEIAGDPFDFSEAPMTLVGGVSFDVTVAYPSGALTLQSANAASKLAVYLDGFYIRPTT